MSEDEKPPERRRMVRPPTGGTAAGRGMGAKMKTADTKSMSSQQWIKRQLSDKWSERARAEGWRSRAAFKLIEIDDKFRLIKRGSRVIERARTAAEMILRVMILPFGLCPPCRGLDPRT